MQEALIDLAEICNLYPTSGPNSEKKILTLDAQDELPEKASNESQSKIIGTAISGSLTGRRNSAFSLFSPMHEFEDIKHQFNLDEFSSQPSEESSQPCSPKQKKDKREQNRLETKNLNRYFRSKINEMLRDFKQNSKNPQEIEKAQKVLLQLNKSNKIMFSQIRNIIKDEWLQSKLKECTGMLLKYIHAGKMGMQSKLIMLKYFNKILKAIQKPDTFTCWK